MIHVATLAELHDGVARAEATGADSIELRRQTLDFALARLRRTPAPSEVDAECIGRISATTNRQLSRNDKWIIAASIIGGHGLLTEDTGIHTQVMGNTGLAQAAIQRGWSAGQIVLVRSGPETERSSVADAD